MTFVNVAFYCWEEVENHNLYFHLISHLILKRRSTRIPDNLFGEEFSIFDLPVLKWRSCIVTTKPKILARSDRSPLSYENDSDRERATWKVFSQICELKTNVFSAFWMGNFFLTTKTTIQRNVCALISMHQNIGFFIKLFHLIVAMDSERLSPMSCNCICWIQANRSQHVNTTVALRFLLISRSDLI